MKISITCPSTNIAGLIIRSVLKKGENKGVKPTKEGPEITARTPSPKRAVEIDSKSRKAGASKVMIWSKDSEDFNSTR